MNRTELHNSIICKTKSSFARSGGSGGQNVNKVNTKVHVFIPVNEIDGICDEERARIRKNLSSILNKDDCLFLDVQDERFQERNREIAMARLEQKIVYALRTNKKRIKTKPTKASKEKRLKIKKIKSEIKKNRQKFW